MPPVTYNPLSAPKTDDYYLGRRVFSPSHSFPQGPNDEASLNPFTNAACHLNLVRVSTGAIFSEQRKSQEIRRSMTRTSTTSHIGNVTHRNMTKAIFAQERHAAFRQSKVASLRRSPAYIVWPSRYPEVLEVSVSESVTSANESAMTSEMGEVGVRVPRTVTETGTHSVASDQTKEDKIALMEAFWDNASGAIRIDSMFYGTMRFDPYQSKWLPNNRRCFFLSEMILHHSRAYVPERIMVENVAKYSKEKKEVKSVRPIQQSRLRLKKRRSTIHE